MKIGRKEIRVPIIQGGMGVGISLGGLAGAVAKEGAVGIISAAQTGFREADFYENTLQANLRAMGKEWNKARNTAEHGVIGFNIMVAMNHYKEYVQEAVRLGADIIISGAGLPTELPKYVREAAAEIGGETLGGAEPDAAVWKKSIDEKPDAAVRKKAISEKPGAACCRQPALAPIVSSEKSAQVILKYWDRKYNCTADVIVIEGPLAGGHLGFSMEKLEEYQKLGVQPYEEEIGRILTVIRSYEEKYEKKIPVFVAGGMDSGACLKRMQQLGADGIQTASRFAVTEECDAALTYKQSYLNAQPQDIVLIQSPVGMPGRAINNHFARETGAGKRRPPSRCTRCLAKCNPKETPYCITEALIKAANGDVEEGLLFCGGNIGKLKKIETVKEVIDSLMEVSL
ncbi:MAG: nitronate monooxygenase family protein [Lachnospiraceae bacterium]|nr:nitronate monooxygenase family protein [Lachnospiraceae bacterium]